MTPAEYFDRLDTPAKNSPETFRNEEPIVALFS
jgi:hypothetical protein